MLVGYLLGVLTCLLIARFLPWLINGLMDDQELIRGWR